MLTPKFAALAGALLALSATAVQAAAGPAEDLTYLFERAHAYDPPAHLRRQQSGSSSASASTSTGSSSANVKPFFQGGPQPTPGAYSPNGKQYPTYASPQAVGKKFIPEAWIERYEAKKAAGLIPGIPQSTQTSNGIHYPKGSNVSDFCNWSINNCLQGDIYLTPDKVAAVTFDDGPTEYSKDLAQFLKANNQSSSHFLIGYNILNSGQAMKDMLEHDLIHVGVHTFSHSVQTTKSDLEVLGDLGWTMQLIWEYTGKVPMYWRPPEGDLDNRVRAIAKQVLGMQAVMWNRDADDWCLKNGGGTEDIGMCQGITFDSVTAEYRGWATNSSAPGINTLMHETKDQTIEAFKSYYHDLKSSSVGYQPNSVPDIIGLPWYQNNFTPDDDTEDVDTILPSRFALNITDGGLAKIGDANGPELGDYKTLIHGSRNDTSSSGSSNATATESAGGDATGSSAAAAASSTSSKSSGATRPIVALSALAAMVPALVFLL